MPEGRLRRLVPDDHPDVLRLAADFHNASAYRRHPLALAKVDELFAKALHDPGYFCIGLADSVTGRLEGYLMGAVHEHYFSYAKTVTDVGFYVSPAYRSMRAVRLMLAAFEDWARSTGAQDWTLGISSGIDDDRVLRLYERLGYDRAFHGLIKQR